MDYKFSSTEQELISMVRNFVLKEVKPLAAEIDEEERFPIETWKKIADMGLTGAFFPEKYGGAETSYVTYIAICEEFAKYCASTSTIYSAHCSLCCWPILEYGTEEQKEKYLPALLSGEKIGAFCLTEPGAGTDAAMQLTIAEDKGDHWLINGSKIFITNSGYASTFIISAMTDKSLGNKGISTFIVEKDTPGLGIGGHIKKMGIRASSTCEVFFTDMKIPKENLLGEVGKGFSVAMATLDGGRIGIAAQALGIAQGAIDECVVYTKQRVQFGKSISKFQNTQFELADMQTKVDAARLLVYRAAQAKQDGEPFSQLAAMAKLFSSEIASEVTRRALQLTGGYGYTREYPFERMMRDAKITEIYEGTSEVQKMVIARYMSL